MGKIGEGLVAITLWALLIVIGLVLVFLFWQVVLVLFGLTLLVWLLIIMWAIFSSK